MNKTVVPKSVTIVLIIKFKGESISMLKTSSPSINLIVRSSRHEKHVRSVVFTSNQLVLLNQLELKQSPTLLRGCDYSPSSCEYAPITGQHTRAFCPSLYDILKGSSLQRLFKKKKKNYENSYEQFRLAVHRGQFIFPVLFLLLFWEPCNT